MATVMPAVGRRADSFSIHEDAQSTADTEMNESALQEDVEVDQEDDELAEDADGGESEYSESSDDETTCDSQVLRDMEKLQNAFAGFRQNYRLIRRIGEGSLPETPVSCVPARPW